VIFTLVYINIANNSMLWLPQAHGSFAY